MKRYNLSVLMHKAWHLFKKAATKKAIAFSEALRLAWRWLKVQAANAAKIEAAAAEAGVTAEYHSWAGWQSLGREVMHGSKAVFQVEVETPERGEGKTFRKAFFVRDQTQPLASVA